MKFVAVTSCPTGIAHTYMAAEALEQAGADAGHEVTVETQGSIGTDPLDPQLIADADGVIFAADLEVKDKARFAGKPFVDVGVKAAVHDAPTVIAQAVAAVEAGPVAGGAGTVAGPGQPLTTGPATPAPRQVGVGARIRQYLMTGVSHMLPFVSAGGILIAIGFLISTVAWKTNGAIEVTKVVDGNDPTAFLDWITHSFSWVSGQDWAVLLFWIGKWAFAFLVPALSGYIAYGIADRPGIAPGFVGGFAAVLVGAGFLGGILTGFLAGFTALWISRWKVPKGVRGIMPVVVIPLLSVGVVGVVTTLIIGPPMRWINDGLTDWLNSLNGGSAILLGAVLGLMMCFDLGGPVNKVAYVFATTGLVNATSNADGPAKIMTAVMVAGMVPPLAIALSTVMRRHLWTPQERDAGKSCWLLGASFISEGAIPFAAADPLRMIPSFMAGGAVAGALSMAFGSGQLAPHGGIWVIALIGKPLLFLVALAAGTVVSAVVLTALKTVRERRFETQDDTPVDAPAAPAATAAA
ncbi:PTS fructose transporter subunit IIC [Luteimicrobium subarcticum]|uniref:PTS system fructose-specific IIC component n=1 Tax=Luteimicrobium subarcticum TaxID=620910 RepID=A0A2M8WVD5_9MICO|nr:fructose-specific PTS transporter subunit EIIC [Luteimicrobium subarcticum]PJI94856.1 PTS system fructose-specific IIC component [Luteimicrobium subarcticum]